MTAPNPVVEAGGVRFGNHLPLAVIAGPCAMESRGHALEVAFALKDIAARLNLPLVFKTSFDKANRTSASGARGIGMAAALPVFAEIREATGLPVRDRRARRRPVRAGGRGGGYSSDSGLPVPADRSPAGRGGHRQGGQCQEGPVPGAVGHGECRGQGYQCR